jgi:glucose/mannose-6-phosphate isomerase
MVDLNAVHEFTKIDTEGMLTHALSLPQTCADAWKLGQQVCPQLKLFRRRGQDSMGLNRLRYIVVVGMGGSAIGGDLLAAVTADECACPIFVHRGYDLPAFVNNPDTLVIGCSHSGNTEETLSAVKQAQERGASVLVLTTGGELARLASGWGAPILRYNYDAQPRAALGYSFTLLLNLMCHIGCITDKAADVAEAVDVAQDWQAEIAPEVPVAQNPAKRLALQLMEHEPVIYGAGLTEPVARRWKTQFNENAKRWASFEGMPELNHNSVVGYEMSQRTRMSNKVVMLCSHYDSSRIRARWRITHKLLLQAAVGSHQITARGQSRLAQMLSLIHFGDLVSIYLAIASEVDPTRITSIVSLKEQLTAVSD